MRAWWKRRRIARLRERLWRAETREKICLELLRGMTKGSLRWDGRIMAKYLRACEDSVTLTCRLAELER